MAIAASIDFSNRPRRPSPVSAETGSYRRYSSVLVASAGIAGGSGGGIVLRHFARRALVCAEGTAPAQVFIVLRGKIRAVRRSDSGREVTLETFQAGDFLPEALVGGDRPLSNDWEASEPADLLVIGRDAFAAQLQASPALGTTLLQQALDRLERSKRLASGLALADVPARVVGSLRALAASAGKDVPEGIAVQNRPTQQELANSIGACRETVSRVISDLARKGLISLRGRSLIVSRRLLAEA